MKLSDIVGVRPLLEKIAAQEMDGASAKQFADFLKDVLLEMQSFESKRADWFQKYGEEVTDGDQKGLRIKPENEKKFNAALKRALSKEIDIEPFDLSGLGVKITPADLLNALSLFK